MCRGGEGFVWEVAGIPLHALCLVSIQSVSIMCSMHKIYMCVHLDGKIGINYVHMRDWQLSEYAIVLNIAHLTGA